jgi:hypothetical protein
MVQAKESCSIFNKITKENLPISKKRFAQWGRGSLQYTKQTRPKKNLSIIYYL